MKKIILTNKKIAGEIEVTYYEGRLLVIDFMKSSMTDIQLDAFMKRFPTQFADLKAFIKDNNFMGVEDVFEVSFDRFWNAYGYKVDKKRSKAVWDRLSIDKRISAFMGINSYNAYLRRNEWRKRMEPKTYLSNERWDDEWI